MGMSLDQLGAGLFYSLTSRLSLAGYYLRAERIGEKIPDEAERGLMLSLARLLITRAQLAAGNFEAAEATLRSLLRKHGGSGFVRGHAYRHLALLAAYRAEGPSADEFLQAAKDEFIYSQESVELGDVIRNSAAVALLLNRVEEARCLSRKALDHYRGKTFRGVIKIWFLLLLCRLSCRFGHRVAFRRLIMRS
jgi:hypothetical protein